MTSAASNTVIDLSGDNDNSGALAALSNLPRLNNSSGETSFERSCDNPECSAPKLISHVPKRETSEFITEPMVLTQPTLINGFTTVFQIDGVATRIEDQMNESTAAEGTAQGVNTNNPKTVFRVVPNTHAHIVNYVVVDGAGDTMRKIKENDAETMRKLLFSQRLSAEQMLKKLIGKALEAPTRRLNPNTMPVPMPVPMPAPALVSVPVPAPATVPVSAPVLLPVAKPNSKPVYKQVSKPVSKPISKPVYKPVYKPVSKPPLKPVPTTKEVLSIVPSGITVKRVSSPESKQNVVSKPSTKEGINSSMNKAIQKPYSSLTPKAKTTTQQPNAAIQSTPISTDAGSRAILATKPVVWQAISSGTALKSTPTSINTTAPKTSSSSTSSGIEQPAVISTARMASSSLATSSQQATTKLPITNEIDTEPLDIENAISAASIATRRPKVESPGVTQQPRVHKRKQDFTTPVQEVFKRLRPRSPTRKQNVTPLAFNLSKATASPPPAKKLPTLNNKLPMRPAGSQKPTVPTEQLTRVEEMQIDAKDEVDANEEEVITPDTVPLSALNSNKKDTQATQEAVEQSQAKEIDNQPVRRKTKPLMGPASKMKALKAMAEEKEMAVTPKNDASNRCKSALISESVPMKIGETIITRTGSLKSKENPPPPPLTPSQPPPPQESLTRPCSVAITDIAKVTTDSDSDSKSTRSTPRTTRRTAIDKDALSSKEPYVKAKQVETLMAKLRTRWTIGKEDETSNAGKSDSPKSGRSTRSSIPKVPTETAQTTETSKSAADEVSDPTLLTSPSAPSRVLRVVLPPPSTKNDSPHPNLKISSIISGDTALAATLGEADTDDNSSGSDIEKLQRELADLRRTVARLTHGKTT